MVHSCMRSVNPQNRMKLLSTPSLLPEVIHTVFYCPMAPKFGSMPPHPFVTRLTSQPQNDVFLLVGRLILRSVTIRTALSMSTYRRIPFKYWEPHSMYRHIKMKIK